MSNGSSRSKVIPDIDAKSSQPSLIDYLLGGPKLSDADAALLADRNKDFGRLAKIPE